MTEIRFPSIIGQPRMRPDVFARHGWFQVIIDPERNEWFWPVMCNSAMGAGDCPACSGIPYWSSIMAEGIEKFFHFK